MQSLILVVAIRMMTMQGIVTQPAVLEGVFGVGSIAHLLSTKDETLLVADEFSREVVFCHSAISDREHVKRDLARACGGRWVEKEAGTLLLERDAAVLRSHRQAIAESIAKEQGSMQMSEDWTSAKAVAERVARNIEDVLLLRDITREPEPWTLPSVKPLDYLTRAVAARLDPQDLSKLAPFQVHEFSLDELKGASKPAVRQVVAMYKDASRGIADYLESLVVDQDVTLVLRAAVLSARQAADSDVLVYVYHDWRTVQVRVTQVASERILGSGLYTFHVSLPHLEWQLPVSAEQLPLASRRLREFQDLCEFPLADSVNAREKSRELVEWFRSSDMDPLDLIISPIAQKLSEQFSYVFIALPDDTPVALTKFRDGSKATFGGLLKLQDAQDPIVVDSKLGFLTVVPAYPLLNLSGRLSRKEMRLSLKNSLDTRVLTLKSKSALAHSSGLGAVRSRLWLGLENALGSLGVLCAFDSLTMGHCFFGGLPLSARTALLSGQQISSRLLPPPSLNTMFGELLSRGGVGLSPLRARQSVFNDISLSSSEYVKLRPMYANGSNQSPPWLKLFTTDENAAQKLAVEANDRSVSVTDLMKEFQAVAQVGTLLTLAGSSEAGYFKICQGCGENVDNEILDAGHSNALRWRTLYDDAERFLKRIRGGQGS